MILQEITRREVCTARPADSIADVARAMRDQNVGAVVVTEDDKVVGIVTDRDIALAVVAGDAAPQQPVSEIMTKDVKTIWEDQGVFNATQYFRGHRIRRLPVIDRQDQLVGIVSADDLFGLFSREIFNVAHALEPALGECV